MQRLFELQRDIDNLKAATAAAGVDGGVSSRRCAIQRHSGSKERAPKQTTISSSRSPKRCGPNTDHVDAGFLLQVDDARAAVTYDRMVPPASFEEYHRWLARHVEILNHALEGIPQDRFATTCAGGAGRDRTRLMFRFGKSSI